MPLSNRVINWNLRWGTDCHTSDIGHWFAMTGEATTPSIRKSDNCRTVHELSAGTARFAMTEEVTIPSVRKNETIRTVHEESSGTAAR